MYFSMTAWSRPLASQCPTYHRIKYNCSWAWLQGGGGGRSRFPFKIDLFFLRPLVRGMLQFLGKGPGYNNAHFLITRQVMSEAEHALQYLLDQPEIRPQTWSLLRHKLLPLLPAIWCIYQIGADTNDFFLNSHRLISLGYVLVQCVADEKEVSPLKKYWWSDELPSYCCPRQHPVS